MFARTIRQSRSLSIMARRSRQPDTRRFNSTKPNVSSSHVLKSPILTGAVGGLTALCGGYAWYYFSGTKEIVDAARSTIKPLESRKATIAYRTPSKNEILSFIKLNRSPHVLFIPGTSTAFEELEELASFDGKELEKIVLDAHNDLRGVIGEGGGMDPETTQKFMDIFILLTGQLQNLAKDAGIKFLDDRPQFRHGVEILEEYGKRYGPETQKIVDETMKQIQEIINQGSSASGLSKAAQLVNEKTREIRKVGREAAEKEWESGIKEVNPYLDKLPQDVKKIVDENIDSVKETLPQAKTSRKMSLN